MTPCVIRQSRGVRGSLSLPGDKSIAHRALILSALSRSPVSLSNFPYNEDCLSTLDVLRQYGIECRAGAGSVRIRGRGLEGLRDPRHPVLIRESGTTFRLMLGVLAGQPFSSILRAGPALSKRPMLRVTAPLRLMGARIDCRKQKGISEEFPPATVSGGGLRPISYRLPVASAQVKSAILLAGLFVPGRTEVREPVLTRDHSERMLRMFGADIRRSGKAILLYGGKELRAPASIAIPGDISSAAFLIAAACILPDSEITVNEVGLNPTRTGVLRVLGRMGAAIELPRSYPRTGEPAGTVRASTSDLTGTVVEKKEVPQLIDELPILMVAAVFARGRSVFRGVGELRVKETDRIRSMMENLKAMGAVCRIRRSGTEEEIVIDGTKVLKGCAVKSFGDHRTAMSMVIAGLCAQGTTRLDDIECIGKSFPGFLKSLKKLESPSA